MTQLVRYMPWAPNLCPHLNMVKKMRTFLEVENKVGPIIPALASQYRPPLPEMNPNVRKGNVTEKRRTVTSKRRFRPVAPKATVMYSPLPQAPPKPASNVAAASVPMMVRQDTPGLAQARCQAICSRTGTGCFWKTIWPQRKRQERKSPTQKKKTKWAQKREANPPHQKELMEIQQQQKPLPKPQAIRPNTLNMTKTKQQWEQEMERLNEKYKLDTFLDSELDSESDEDEQYQYQHGYEMLI